MAHQQVKFYQTGTLTVGNRLLDDAQRTVQATLDRSNSLESGHRACQGCGEALGARYAIDAAMRATDNQLIAALPRGVHHPVPGVGLAHPVDALAVRQRPGDRHRHRRRDEGQGS
jgi:hypothetical protein